VDRKETGGKQLKMLSLCLHLAILTLMKRTPLTVRGCPSSLHQTLKKSAKANRRSLNGETLTWLEQQASAEKPKPAKELAPALRQAHQLLSDSEHKQIGEGIEKARRQMADEHLH